MIQAESLHLVCFGAANARPRKPTSKGRLSNRNSKAKLGKSIRYLAVPNACLCVCVDANEINNCAGSYCRRRHYGRRRRMVCGRRFIKPRKLATYVNKYKHKRPGISLYNTRGRILYHYQPASQPAKWPLASRAWRRHDQKGPTPGTCIVVWPSAFAAPVALGLDTNYRLCLNGPRGAAGHWAPPNERLVPITRPNRGSMFACKPQQRRQQQLR